MSTKVSESEIRSIAVAAGCDPRTVRKVLAGERVMPLTRARICEELDERGVKYPKEKAP